MSPTDSYVSIVGPLLVPSFWEVAESFDKGTGWQEHLVGLRAPALPQGPSASRSAKV